MRPRADVLSIHSSTAFSVPETCATALVSASADPLVRATRILRSTRERRTGSRVREYLGRRPATTGGASRFPSIDIWHACDITA
jgi:hypothetical protein